MNDPVADACPRTLDERFPQRATTWQLRTIALELPPVPLVMGIVNVTPDSFSDGGMFLDTGAAVEHGLKLAAGGADILDIGGESTRPFSDTVDADEELRRVVPVVQALAEQVDIPISIDTSKASVALESISAGAQIINDVTGLQGDPQMVQVANASHAGLCVMHMQGSPQTMQLNPQYGNVVEEIIGYLRDRRDALVKAGVQADRICLDMGIGFGKTHGHNLQLLAAAHEFHTLGHPLLVGHSRKGFLAKILGDKETDRTQATVGVGLAMAAAGVQILRVHDVIALRQALLGFAAVGGVDGTVAEI